MSLRLFNVACVLSLVVAVGSAFAWAWSYLPGPAHLYALHGQLALLSIDASDENYTGDVVDRGPQQAWDYLGTRATVGFHLLGFRMSKGVYALKVVGSRRATYVLLAVPFWFLLALSLVLPGLWMFKRSVANRRNQTNQCTKCGYDLRATPDLCPECGTRA